MEWTPADRIHQGHETGADWAAVMVLAKDESGYKVAKYHIIVVSVPASSVLS